MPQIQTPDGQVFNFPDTMSRAQIAEALQRRLGNKTQPQVQPQQQQAAAPQDTSMGSAFKVADAQSQGASMSGTASLQRNLSQGPFGQFLQSATDNYINPIREGLGFDPIDRAQVDADASARLQAGADRANAEAEKIAEDLDFYNMTTSDINSVGDFVNFIGQKTAQAAPYMGAALASGGTLTYPFAVGEISQNLSEIEGLPQEKADDIAAAGGAISAALETLGIAKLLPKGASNSILGGIANGVITEGTTEGLQELVNIGSEAVGGKQFSEGEILNRLKEAAAAGSVAGGAFKGSTQAASKAKSLFTSDGKLNVNNLDDPTKLAAADVARELQQIATAEGFNLKNVNISSQFGAKGALEEARKQNNGEITELVKALKGKLNSKNAKSLDQVLTDYAPANAAIKQGKNKVSGYVNKADMAALARLVGPYQEGAALMNALAKSNVITGLFKDGMKGGVSQFTDYFNPLGTSGAVYDPTRLGNIVLGGGLAATTGFSSVPIQAGIVGLGRLVDAATGRRNKLARFVNKNVNAQGLPSPSGVSLVDKAKAAESDAKVRREALARIATQIDAPPNANSPVGTILSGTGLSRDGLSQTINSMAQDFAGQPELAPVLESIQQNMDGDTNPVLELNEIIPIIGQYAQMTAPELIVATPDNPLLARGVQQSPAQTDVQTEAPSQPRSESSINADFDALAIEKKQLEAQASSIQDEISNLSLEEAQARKQEFAARMAPIQQRLADISSQMDSLGAENQARRSGNQFTTPENYQAGKSDNNSFARTLASQVSEDAGVSVSDKAQLMTALEDVQSSLGPDPVAALDEITTELQNIGVNRDVIDTYFKPYRDRVALQQARVGRMQAPSDQSPAGPTLDQSSVSNATVIEGAVRKIMEGNMDPASVKAMLNQLEQNNPGIKARILEITDPQQQSNAQDPDEPTVASINPDIPRGESTNVPMETAVTRSSNMARSKVYAKGRDLKLDIQKASLKAQKANNINLREMTPENVVRLADFAVFDALEALKTNQNAIGWYEGTIDQMVDNLSQIVPEIKTSQPNRIQFFWALAVTSNGLKVDKNLDLAVKVYEHLQKTGRFPTNMGIGTAAQGIDEGLAKYHKMIDKFNGNHQALEDFMLKKMRAGDIEGIVGIKPTGEGENATVRGAAILGAKIGNGFFSNLYGEYDALTMDRWLMRTVGRWRGNLVKKNKPMERKKRDQLWDYLRALDDTQLARLKKLFKGTGTKISNKAMSDAALDKLAVATAKASMKPEWRDLINSEFKDIRLIGNGLAGYLDGQVEIPSGPVERQHIRDIFQKGLDDLNNNPEVRKISNKPLTMADFQALLWYQEKLLYDTAKKPIGVQSKEYKDDEAPDYANAAKKLADNRRRNANGNRLGSSGSNSRRGGGPSSSNDGQRGQSVSKGALELNQDAPILSRALERAGSADGIRKDEQGQTGRPKGVGALALQGATEEPQVVTSLNGLNEPDVLNDFLARPGWAIITATNENLPDSIRDTRNAENNAYLEQQLNKQGIPFITVSGAYQGIDQGPSFLILADEETAMKLGKFHLQESILTNQGLVYTRRPAATTPATGKNMFGPQAQQQDFYSTVSDLPFSMGLDFDIGPAKQFYKPGYTEAPNRPQLPMRERDGMVELHHWSDKRRKTIDPHFAGSGPLNGVERKRAAKISFFGIAPRQSLRDPGTGYVKEAGLGSFEHVALIDPKDLYPVFQDPDGLLKGVGSNWSKAEDIIKDAGYKGYYTTDDGSGSAPLGNVATLFESIKVSEVTGELVAESKSPIAQLIGGPTRGASNTGPRLPIIPRQKPEVTADHYKRVSQSIRPAFEVGKEGSEFEDGVPDFEAAVDVARKMGIVVKLASSQKEMTVTNSLDTNKPITPNLSGAYQRVGAKKRGKGYEGTIWAMRPGATKADGSTVSDIEALTTLLHEISHAITMGSLDGKADQEIVSYFINRQQSSKPETNIAGRSDFSVPGSFVDSAIRPLLENDYNQMTPKQQRIYSEIVNLQETVDAYSPKNPNERRAVRFIRRAYEIGMSPEGVQTYKDYTRMAVEFAVDPVWVYLINPKLAKKLMPLTSKLIQSEFRKAGGKTIQFYAHPLAVVIAAFAALELARDEEEERQKQQQMAPGALTPPPGALSAA